MWLKSNKTLYLLGILLAANMVVHDLLHDSYASNALQSSAECVVCEQFESVVPESQAQTSFTYLNEFSGSDYESFFPANTHNLSFPRAPPRI